MSDHEQGERPTQPEIIKLTADGMIMVGAIKYIASQRQTELIRALATAPGQFLSSPEVSDALESLGLKEASTENMQRWMEGMVRFGSSMFESKKENEKMYFRMLDHVVVVDELPPGPRQ